MGIGGGQPAQQTQVTERKLPGFIEPFAIEGAERARTFLDQPQQFFPGSTVVPFSQQTEQALTGIEQRAIAGSPLTGAAQAQTLETIQGRGVNPFLSGAVQAATDPIVAQFQRAVAPTISAQFAGAGRSGSGLERTAVRSSQEALAGQLGGIGSQLAFKSAEGERARQEAAIRSASGLANIDFQNLQRLGQVGQSREALSQAQLQEEINRFQFGQGAEGAALDAFLTRIGAASGGAFTAQQQQFGPQATTGGRIGGALSGGLAGSSFGPVGTGIGAILGSGLLG